LFPLKTPGNQIQVSRGDRKMAKKWQIFKFYVTEYSQPFENNINITTIVVFTVYDSPSIIMKMKNMGNSHSIPSKS
jgi:hypothetical protein